MTTAIDYFKFVVLENAKIKSELDFSQLKQNLITKINLFVFNNFNSC